MSEAIDGEFQKLSATDGMYNRENFFSKYEELAALVANMSDSEIDMLQRGGMTLSKFMHLTKVLCCIKVSQQ